MLSICPTNEELASYLLEGFRLKEILDNWVFGRIEHVASKGENASCERVNGFLESFSTTRLDVVSPNVCLLELGEDSPIRPGNIHWVLSLEGSNSLCGQVPSALMGTAVG